VSQGRTVTASVIVLNSAGIPASGRVVLQRVAANGAIAGTVASGVLREGRAALRLRVSRTGTWHYRARFAGNANYLGGTSAAVALRVT
jgi:hypothetical protein